jgi:hypothetical protein
MAHLELVLGLPELRVGLVEPLGAPRHPRVHAIETDAGLGHGGHRVGAGVRSPESRLQRDDRRLGLAQVGAQALDLALEEHVALRLGALVDRGVDGLDRVRRRLGRRGPRAGDGEQESRKRGMNASSQDRGKVIVRWVPD